MKKWLMFLLATSVAAALAAGMSRAPEALRRLEVFRVTDVDFGAGRYLTRAEALETLALRPDANVWDDREVLEARLRDHPLVRDARVRRRFPGTLLLEIEEEEPVALYPNPTLEPIDGAGRILPIDPAAHRLDLPLIAMAPGEDREGLTPGQRRLLAEEITRIGAGEPRFLARISEITLEGREELRASVWDPPLTLHFRPGLSSRRIREALRVLEDAGTRFQDARVVDLDLRYDDQVVVRVNRVEGE